MYYSSHFLTIDSHSKCISLNEYSKVSFIPGHSVNNVLLYSCLRVLLYFCINKQNVAIRPWINVSISLVSFMSKLVLRENSSGAAMSPDFWIQRIFLEKDFLKIQWIHFRPLNKIWKVPTHSILLLLCDWFGPILRTPDRGEVLHDAPFNQPSNVTPQRTPHSLLTQLWISPCNPATSLCLSILHLYCI